MRVIFNADDFGRRSSINAAVVRAHREGVLTSASLMITGEAVREAVAMAEQAPALGVGLHLVLACGRAALPHKEIPHLVDASDRFPSDAAWAGLRYFLVRSLRAELARELAAQFERFAATGLSLSHVDGHLHIHVHPTVFDLILPMARDFGARGLRLPRDDLRLSLGYDQRHAGAKATWAAVYGCICRWCTRRLAARCNPEWSPVVVDRVFGLMQTGEMREAYVVRALERLVGRSAEFYFHPDAGAAAEPLGPNPGDLRTLLSPAVREAIRRRGIVPSTYEAMASAGGG